MMPNGSLCPFNSNRFVSDLQLANWPNATPSIRMKDVLHFLNLFLSRFFVLDENNIDLSLLWPTGSEDSCILRLCNMLVIDEHFKRSWKPKAHHWNQKDTLLRSFEDKNAFPFVLAIGPFARKQNYCLTATCSKCRAIRICGNGIRYDCMIGMIDADLT